MDIDLIKRFAKFCQKKFKIQNLPKIKLTKSRKEIQTTAGYKRGREIIVYINGRHQVDICRSLAHELKHHKQWEDKEFNDTEKIQDVGGKFEDEANAAAGEVLKQFAYAGNMNIYESRKILFEGRLEDAQKKYPGVSKELIAYISKIDPSGNNKYLSWILKQLRYQTLINPEINQKVFVDEIIWVIEDFNGLLPYIDVKTLDTSQLTQKILKKPKDINAYDNIDLVILVNNMVKPIFNEKQKNKALISKSEVIFEDTDYVVIRMRTYEEMLTMNNPIRVNGVDISKQNFNNFYCFMVVNKNENAGQKKISVFIRRIPNSGQNILVLFDNRNVITVEELKSQDQKYAEFINLMELWVENMNKQSTIWSQYDYPELYALKQYLGDDNLKHYKENPDNSFYNYTYNNGKTSEDYFVGDLSATKNKIIQHHLDVFRKKPKSILRFQPILSKHIKLGLLINAMKKHFGFNSLFIDQEKLKKYYKIPPLKLNANEIEQNSDKFNRLSQIDEYLSEIQTEILKIKKETKTNTRLLYKIDNELQEKEKKLTTLNKRSEQLKQNTTEYQKIQQTISEYDAAINFVNKEKIEISNKNKELNKKIEILNKKKSNYMIEYTEIVNEIESTRKNDINYEYSKKQLSDAEKQITKDLTENPMEWIKILNIKEKDLINMVNLDGFLDDLFNEKYKVLSNFGTHKLVSTENVNTNNFYIYVNNKK